MAMHSAAQPATILITIDHSLSIILCCRSRSTFLFWFNWGQIPINSWIPDQVEDDAGVWGMTLPLVIPGFNRESRKSWIPDQVEDDAGVSG